MPQTKEADPNSNAANHTAVEIDEPIDPGPDTGDPSRDSDISPSGLDFDVTDGSYALYTLYSEKMAEIDRELVNNLTEHISDLIVLGGLVSAAIAAFLAPSYIASLSTFEDNVLFYLALIYQLFSKSDQGDTPSMSMPILTYALWFCGLGMSLSSAMFAMLVQSWIRGYMVKTRPQQSPRSRAFIQVYVMLRGLLESQQLTVDLLHLLLDTAIFTFLLGLTVAIWKTVKNHVISALLYIITYYLWCAYAVVSWKSSSRHTIRSTPLSRLTHHFANLKSPPNGSEANLNKSFLISNFKLPPNESNAFLGYDLGALDHLDQAAEMLFKAHPLLLDKGIVARLLRSLHHDRDLEQFLESIPGFYDSDLVKQPEHVFRPFHEDQVPRAILSFMRRTLSSATFPDETTKQKRIMLSLEVMELDPYLLERTFFHALSLPAKPTMFRCIDFVLTAHKIACTAKGSEDVQLLARCIIAVAISHMTAKKLNKRWFRIVKHWSSFPISISGTISNEQLANMKLVNLVWLVEELNSAGDGYRDKILHNALDAASNFPVPAENVVSPSQNKFCVVWNRLLESVTATPAPESTAAASLILPHIRTIYNALRGGTNDSDSPVDPNLSPANYPHCTDPTHPANPDLTPGTSSNPVAHASGEDPILTTPQDVIPVANDDLPN